MSPSRLGSKTVQEGWPLPRLLRDVACVRRTWTVSVVRRRAIVTGAGQPWAVVVPLAPAAALGDDVVHCYPIVRRKEQAALRTRAVLSLQESRDSGRALRMVSEARTPICPSASIGTAPTVDFHVTPDGRVSVSIPVGASVRGLQDPSVARGHAPGPRGDPRVAVVGMAGGRPSAPQPLASGIQTREETRTANPGVRPCPPDHDRVEPSDQRRLARLAMALHAWA